MKAFCRDAVWTAILAFEPFLQVSAHLHPGARSAESADSPALRCCEPATDEPLWIYRQAGSPYQSSRWSGLSCQSFNRYPGLRDRTSLFFFAVFFVGFCSAARFNARLSSSETGSLDPGLLTTTRLDKLRRSTSMRSMTCAL